MGNGINSVIRKVGLPLLKIRKKSNGNIGYRKYLEKLLFDFFYSVETAVESSIDHQIIFIIWVDSFNVTKCIIGFSNQPFVV